MTTATYINPETEYEQFRAISRNRRERGSFSNFIPKNQEADIATDYSKGLTLAQLSESYMIGIPTLRAYLVELNILRKRGQGTKVQRRNRQTLKVTTELLNQAKVMLNSHGGIVKTAKALNLNIAELTVALKADGMIFSRGRKAKQG